MIAYAQSMGKCLKKNGLLEGYFEYTWLIFIQFFFSSFSHLICLLRKLYLETIAKLYFRYRNCLFFLAVLSRFNQYLLCKIADVSRNWNGLFVVYYLWIIFTMGDCVVVFFFLLLLVWGLILKQCVAMLLLKHGSFVHLRVSGNKK